MWILKVKRKGDGFLDKYKACFVAKSYTQSECVEYKGTFSLVGDSIYLPSASSNSSSGFQTIQLDVKTTFNDGELDEETYMKQPIGVARKGNECKVCHFMFHIWSQTNV